jgi:hypothetical protein
MKAQIVRCVVPAERRESYLDAWKEWSGQLFTMGIETRLLESDDRAGRFVEITWFEEGQQAVLADDRMVRAGDALAVPCESREGALELLSARA